MKNINNNILKIVFSLILVMVLSIYVQGNFLASKETMSSKDLVSDVKMIADEPVYKSLEELISEADIIVKGKITGKEYTDYNKAPFTFYDLKIQKQILGEVKTIIRVGQLGGKISTTNQSGELEEIIVYPEGNPEFPKEKSQILFLKKVEKEKYKNNVPFDYYVVGSSQGRFLINTENKMETISKTKYLERYKGRTEKEFIKEILALRKTNS